MREIWKNVVGYEGLYQVSSKGKVKSLDRLIKGRRLKGKRMSVSTNYQGYKHVNLHQDNIRKGFFVHTLVSEAFIGPRPEGKIILHGPIGSSDNRVSQLRYGTLTENSRDRHRDGTLYRSPVLRSDGVYYSGVMEAATDSGGSHGNIVRCCQGKRKTCKGFGWSYV